jgi:hypothetical protein
MKPRKMMKKPDAVGEGSNPNADVISDTTPRTIDTVKSWTQVFKVLEHEIINCPEYFGEEVDDTHEANLIYISQSELHKIVAQLRLITYKDMISWALENIDDQTMSITNHRKVVVGSFRLEHL